MPDNVYDVVVAGAGPAGTTAALYTSRAGFKTLLLDKAKVGGALSWAHQIENYPGIGFREPISGAGLLMLMHEHAQKFGAEFHPYQVYGFELSVQPFRVVTSPQVFEARALVVASGARSRSRPVPGEEELTGRGVAYCATCDGPFFAGHDVAVVGNSEEALTEAFTLSGYVSSIHLVNPTGRFIAEEEDVEALKANPKVQIHFNRAVSAIEGNEKVERLRLEAPGGLTETLPVQGVFLYLAGNKPGTEFLQGQVELDAEGYIVTDAELQTSVPGVYAAGDIRGNKLRQVLIAGADGAMAAMAIDKRLRGRSKIVSQR